MEHETFDYRMPDLIVKRIIIGHDGELQVEGNNVNGASVWLSMRFYAKASFVVSNVELIDGTPRFTREDLDEAQHYIRRFYDALMRAIH